MKQRRARKSKKAEVPPALRFAFRVTKYTAIAWLSSLVFFRFVNPPITPLIALRGVVRMADGKDAIDGWSWVPIRSIPVYVRQAIVAAEDARFVEHHGIDVDALLSVVRSSSSKPSRGASTITMQTVKNVFLWPGRSYVRKAIEIVLSPIADIVWGKERTLELYLNVAEWGDGIYGIEAAAQHYFKKSVDRISPSQAAALASVLPAPRTLSPLALSRTSRLRYLRIIRELPTTVTP